jgi:hypothetical protein
MPLSSLWRAYVPALFLDRARLFSSFLLWGPGVIAIAVALLVAVVIRSSRVPWRGVLNAGLAFGVAGSYGIAASEFLDPTGISVGAG